MEVSKSLFYFVIAGLCESEAVILFGSGCVKARASAWLWLAPLCLFYMESFPRCNLFTLAESTRLMAGSSSFFQYCGVGRLTEYRQTDLTCLGV